MTVHKGHVKDKFHEFKNKYSLQIIMIIIIMYKCSVEILLYHSKDGVFKYLVTFIN